MSSTVFFSLQYYSLHPADTSLWVKASTHTFLSKVALRIEGTAYGQAIGDGLGMFTEFLSYDEAQSHRKSDLEFSDRASFARPHVNRFARDGWTDDTDQALMIVRAEQADSQNASKSKEVQMAQQLLNWRSNGLNHFIRSAV